MAVSFLLAATSFASPCWEWMRVETNQTPPERVETPKPSQGPTQPISPDVRVLTYDFVDKEDASSKVPSIDPDRLHSYLDDTHRMADALTRLADHFVPPPADIVDTTYVADRLGCSIEWISQQARQGLIPKSCLVEGTGNGKPWKFRRHQVDDWIVNR